MKESSETIYDKLMLFRGWKKKEGPVADLIFTRIYARNQRHSSSLRKVAPFLLLMGLVCTAFAGYLPQLGQYASANSNIVQNQVTGSVCTLESSCKVNLDYPSSVSSGDVIVVATFDLGSTSLVATDSLSSSYTALASTVDKSGDGMYVFAATLATSGKDAIILTDSSGNSTGIYAEFFEVSAQVPL